MEGSEGGIRRLVLSVTAPASAIVIALAVAGKSRILFPNLDRGFEARTRTMAEAGAVTERQKQ